MSGRPAEPPPAPPALALEFERHGERFALPAALVRQVVVEPPVTRVPGAPAALIGLMGFRGAVVPLLEPGGEAPAARAATQPAAASALVAEGATGLLALAADAVHGFCADGEASAPPPLDLAMLELRVRARVNEPAGDAALPDDERDRRDG